MQLTASKTKKGFRKIMRRYWMLYLMVLPVMLYFILFKYLPMFGIVMAFQDFKVTRGFFESEWVGFSNFLSFFNSIYFWTVIRNTLSISLYGLIFSFPAPIILALMLNELKNMRFKKAVQTITYMPHFISLVIICGLIREFFSGDGLFNAINNLLGLETVHYLNEPNWFYPIYIGSYIWQHVGWSSIIYLAALSAIDVQLYDAATIDGAGRFQKIWHVTLPGLSPTITMLLILNIGRIMSVGFEKIILLYSPLVYEKADVISTFV
ncbi:MAG: ABC transporter permease subunit, partial [Clostridia bacterium]|nr:ABC transporter permease subunit [Clostridia bacterium]